MTKKIKLNAWKHITQIIECVRLLADQYIKQLIIRDQIAFRDGCYIGRVDYYGF